MKKKVLCILIALSLSAAMFFSCASKDKTDDNAEDPTSAQGTSDSDSNVSEEGTTAEQKILPNLGDANFNGYKFRVLYRSIEEQGVWGSRDIYAEAENAEPINDAVYRRNKYLEDKYKFEIVGIPSAGGSAGSGSVKKIIQSGTDTYDAMMLQQNQVGALITSNCLLNLKSLPNLDLNQPWWDKTITDDLSFGDKIYATMGDIHITSNYSLRVLLFNKDMVKDYGLEDPYALVNENKWTLDKFTEMCKNVSFDENGDGIFDEKDRYGYLVQTGITVNMFYACNENMTTKDADNMPVVSLGNDRSMIALDKINSILANKNAVMFDSDYSHVNKDHPEYVLQDVFEAKRGLFFAEVLQLAERMRATDTLFGILPMPKLDANQPDYYSFADSYCMTLVTVPATIGGDEDAMARTGFILEAMSAESTYTTKPAFYDNALKSKFARDNESSAMLDIIIKHKIVSMDELYGWGLQTAVQNTLRKLDNSFASAIEKATSAAQNKIDKTIITMESLN